LIRPTEEDLKGEAPARVTAERTLNCDGLKWELSQAGQHVAAAALAGDHEGHAISGCLEHASIIGENKANSPASRKANADANGLHPQSETDCILTVCRERGTANGSKISEVQQT
jgi:hypothetical protein